jgi:hypothetical protein
LALGTYINPRIHISTGGYIRIAYSSDLSESSLQEGRYMSSIPYTLSMGSASDVYTSLKKRLEGSGSRAQVILPGDGEVYEQSIKRWSEHCVKRAVCPFFSPFNKLYMV